MDKLLFRRILITVLSVLAVIYVGYLLISSNIKIYPTENAVQTTVTDKIYTNAFIIRDEKILTNNTSGVLSYSVSDGSEVSVNGEIAKIYSNDSDAAAQTKADMLEEKLKSLEELQKSKNAGSIGIDTINNDINNKIISYLSDINYGNITSSSKDMNSLVDSINQNNIYTGKTSDFNAEIAELQTQINELRSSSGESIASIKSDKAGYFSAHCDGYENCIKYSNIERLKLDDLKNVKKSETPDNSVGKIVGSLNWYVACEVTAEEATDLSIWDGGVSILFSDATTESIPATIYKINQENPDSPALVILRCDYMDEGLIEARNEPIEIGLGTYSGLRISKRAIHDDYVEKVTYDDNDNKSVEKKKVQGVYVLYGSEVQFKQISIIYADSDYVICDPSPDEDLLFNGETVSLYDQIIIEGEDLYDGKIIE